MELSKKDAELRSMGRINPKRRVTEIARTILDENIVQMVGFAPLLSILVNVLDLDARNAEH